METDMTFIEELIEKAKKLEITADDQEAQRRSFAYGNAKIENPQVTMAMVVAAAEARPTK